jgi:hypothetical protein
MVAPIRFASVSQITYVKPRLRLNDGTMRTRVSAMCDLAYVNFLREKVRQLEAEERRLQAFGPTPSTRFVPFTLTTVDVGPIPRELVPEMTPDRRLGASN